MVVVPILPSFEPSIQKISQSERKQFNIVEDVSDKNKIEINLENQLRGIREKEIEKYGRFLPD